MKLPDGRHLINVILLQTGGGPDYDTGVTYEVQVEGAVVTRYASPAELGGVINTAAKALMGYNPDGTPDRSKTGN